MLRLKENMYVGRHPDCALRFPDAFAELNCPLRITCPHCRLRRELHIQRSQASQMEGLRQEVYTLQRSCCKTVLRSRPSPKSLRTLTTRTGNPLIDFLKLAILLSFERRQSGCATTLVLCDSSDLN